MEMDLRWTLIDGGKNDEVTFSGERDPEEVALWDGLLHFVKVSHVASRPTTFEISTAFQPTLRFDLNVNLGRPSLGLSLDE